jgi:hypothetical protein
MTNPAAQIVAWAWQPPHATHEMNARGKLWLGRASERRTPLRTVTELGEPRLSALSRFNDWSVVARMANGQLVRFKAK